MACIRYLDWGIETDEFVVVVWCCHWVDGLRRKVVPVARIVSGRRGAADVVVVVAVWRIPIGQRLLLQLRRRTVVCNGGRVRLMGASFQVGSSFQLPAPGLLKNPLGLVTNREHTQRKAYKSASG